MANNAAPTGAATFTTHTQPLGSCVDYFGDFDISEIGKVQALAKNSNNPECYANMVWAKNNSIARPDMYPEGSKTMADFQCALYLKGVVNGINEPGPHWNCSHPPCAGLRAPLEHAGSEDTVPAGAGTDYCVEEVPVSVTTSTTTEPPLPACSMTNGVNRSAVYPCTCPGTPSAVCDATTPICHPVPSPNLCMAALPPPKPVKGPKGPKDDGMPLWVPILVAALLAALVAGCIFIGSRMMKKPKAPPAKKRAPAPAMKSAPPPVVELPPPEPTPEPQQPLLYAAPQPVVTTAMPLPTASVIQQAPPVVTAAPRVVEVVEIIQAPPQILQAAPQIIQGPTQVIQEVMQVPVQQYAAAPVSMVQPTFANGGIQGFNGPRYI
eukprot:TRINITY_DN622_c0_g1_i2.p1 TRINITY_DN622_c0_g1~~TRINITY_DN622_c0_g1_i2.p1  ORF type:complete len:379 (+),score=84.89 TRINITY_DN622_c0_g1_i2:90-1226(+)